MQKKKPNLPNNFSPVEWAITTVFFGGAFIGGLISLYESGIERGKREMYNRLKEKDANREK